MASVRAIAGSLGLSPATVSRSLNNSSEVRETVRRKVLAEARRLGYELPRKPTQTRTIGLLFLNETSGPKFSGYDAVIWGGVARGALSLKYDTSVINPLDRGPEETFKSFMARKGVEGLIVRVDGETRHACIDLAAEGVPHVVVADRFEDERVSYICCNSFQPSRAAVEHLLHLGHRRIAVCNNNVPDTDHHDRIAAYKEVLSDADIEIDPALIVSAKAEVGGGVAAFNRLLSLPKPPTAIFFANPALTVGALRRALEVGIRVPEELSIIGIDDERLRKLTHPIYTAVCQDAAELGQQAGRWLCRQLSQMNGSENKRDPLRLEIEAFLEINQTTAPPPAQAVRMTPMGQRLTEE